MLETAYQDVENLDLSPTSPRKAFEVGIYITIYGNDLKDLARLENLIVSLMESKLVYVKPALFSNLAFLRSCLVTDTGHFALR